MGTPLARSTDPATSHEAARSVEPHITSLQALVLKYLKDSPMTDEELVRCLSDCSYMSPSGIRTRRCELVRAGLVEDTGLTRPTRSGRRSIVWRAK
jgi:hypothetical protein